MKKKPCWIVGECASAFAIIVLGDDGAPIIGKQYWVPKEAVMDVDRFEGMLTVLVDCDALTAAEKDSDTPQ